LNRFKTLRHFSASIRIADLEDQMLDSQPAQPSSWAMAYVGLPYVVGVGECAHRAALVWREQFGFEVEVAPAWGDMTVAQARIRAELAKADWYATPQPREGDAVVMWKGDLLAHVGIWVAPGHVLHCTRAQGMVLTPVADLPRTGFRVFGFYRRRDEMAVAA
jgi:hypothetical protein